MLMKFMQFIILKINKNLDKVKWHKLDLFKDHDVERVINKIQPTYIIHLAWYTEHGKFGVLKKIRIGC